jgi:hypothetical protein
MDEKKMKLFPRYNKTKQEQLLYQNYKILKLLHKYYNSDLIIRLVAPLGSPNVFISTTWCNPYRVSENLELVKVS